MENFALIIICFALGIVFRLYKTFPATAPQVLNRFVIYISMPALTVAQLHRLELGTNFLVPVSMPWIVYALGIGFFYVLGKHAQLSKKTVGTLILTGSLGNTSFLGFPMIEALYGVGALSVAILVDQPGSFLVSGILGVATAAYCSGSSLRVKTIVRRIFSFPPTYAMILAVPLRAIEFSPEAFHLLDRLASTLVPLALVSVGMQLHINPAKIKAHFKTLCWGLGFKLILVPLFCIGLYIGLFNQQGSTVLITIMESTMAPMITAGIIAAEYDLDTELSNLMIGIGIPLSLITVPLWAWVLRGV